jgi:hypothetical protein
VVVDELEGWRLRWDGYIGTMTKCVSFRTRIYLTVEQYHVLFKSVFDVVQREVIRSVAAGAIHSAFNTAVHTTTSRNIHSAANEGRSNRC